MKQCRQLISLLLAFLLLFGGAVLSEEEEEEIEFLPDDEVFLEDTTDYGDVPWNFPVDLQDMDPAMIRLANKYVLLGKDYKPDPIMTMVRRKANKDGSNANGGVNKASTSEMKLQKECGEALVAMFEGALQDGITLYLKSAYRSYQTQNTMYYNRLKNNHGKDDGWVSKPGASDHQTGLGCDIVSKAWRSKAMNAQFAKTKEAEWMKEHAQEYGFILRYPKDKEDLTEINFEPWHYRYVGIPAANYIMNEGICLEEFHEQLQTAIDQFLEDGGNPKLVEPYIQRSAE
ncbi:MAG: M15 family metallopeptidase [Clostridia bacterium]|nr:M15 family metallopeptidase [Clostridia bacterium]